MKYLLLSLLMMMAAPVFADAHDACDMSGKPQTHLLTATADNVHWGYFSAGLEPRLVVRSGDTVTVETLTHHANDDAHRMVDGDAGATDVYYWDETTKNVDRRGAGPEDHPRGTGGGFGVHILTGPIYVCGAEPGDVIEVKITDMSPRPSGMYPRSTFGSNAAAAWGFHYGTLLDPREVITIYEMKSNKGTHYATPLYNFRWTPQTDPFGVVHEVIDYPGVPVDHSTVVENWNMPDVRVPARLHWGTMGVAPVEQDPVDSVPPSYTGGNIDNWRIGKGGTMYYPVAVDGALLSMGDPHAAQGDSELAGTAIETSLTGTVEIVLHKAADLPGTMLEAVNYPLLETKTEWVVHGFSFANYLAELGDDAQSEIYGESSVDLAMNDAYLKMRDFLMTAYDLDEDAAVSLMSVSVDFGITQVVDGNWGVHGILKKCVFKEGPDNCK